MPSYNLAQPEEQVVVTWLFEPLVYLDVESIALGPFGGRAREAFVADPGLDLTQWVRDNSSQGWIFNGRRYDSVGAELAMVWWIWKNDQVNITPQVRPPETAAWIATLQGWDDSIDAGFARGSQQSRNDSSVPIFDEAGNETVMPAGAHLAHQQQIISKLLGVLQ